MLVGAGIAIVSIIVGAAIGNMQPNKDKDV